MELTDEIKGEGEDKKGEGELFFAMLNGKTVKETIHTRRGDFVVKYPKQRDLMLIDRKVASMRANIEAAQFDSSANSSMQAVAFLDTVVETGPEWYKAAKAKNSGFSWGDVPDSNFIFEVYVKALSFRNKVQEKLNGDGEKAPVALPEDLPRSVDKAVGDGVFSGVAREDK